MNQDTTLRWLKFGSALTIFFGVLVAAAATPIGAAPAQFLADLNHQLRPQFQILHANGVIFQSLPNAIEFLGFLHILYLLFARLSAIRVRSISMLGVFRDFF